MQPALYALNLAIKLGPEVIYLFTIPLTNPEHSIFELQYNGSITQIAKIIFIYILNNSELSNSIKHVSAIGKKLNRIANIRNYNLHPDFLQSQGICLR